MGSGGREHALAWKLAGCPSVTALHAAPGSPGIARLGECHPIRAEDAEDLLALARSLDIELVVVGPEAPLVHGVADVLRHAGVPVFGPSAAAARIEGSKAFAKEVMTAAGVPTAAAMPVARVPCVVKADGLAAGKGVFVCRSPEELDVALGAVGSLGGAVRRRGAARRARRSRSSRSATVWMPWPLAPAQDFKRAYDGDEGPNTGGMGSYAPVPGLGPAEVEQVLETVHRPVLEELGRRGAPFIGLLYAGLMLTEDGLRVLEFNCRFGDPETQSVLPLLDGDLAQVLAAASLGELSGVSIEWKEAAAVTVVVAAAEYPARGDRGSEITGLAEAERHALVFHAGTAVHGDRVVTNGGRVLNVTGVGESIGAAREAAYAGVGEIAFDGAWSRADIALAAAEGRVLTLSG